MILSNKHLVEVFFAKLKFNLKSEASKTYLGYIWWVLEPALYVAVLYLVFGVFRAQGGVEFVIFLVCGKIPFLWFSKSISNSTNSILGGRGLINQVAISKAFFPLMVVAQDLVKQFFVFIFMFIFLIWVGPEPNLNWIFIVFVMTTQLLLIVACSLFAASITPFLPDFRYIVTTGMVLLMLTSGIFFDYKRVILEKHQTLFLMNPMANLLKNYRQVLMEGAQPDWLDLAVIALTSILFIHLMLMFYRKFSTKYAMLISQ